MNTNTPSTDEENNAASELFLRCVKEGGYTFNLLNIGLDHDADKKTLTIQPNPRYLAARDTKMLEQAERAVLQELITKARKYPIHGGTDSFYPTTHVMAVPVEVIKKRHAETLHSANNPTQEGNL